eukprot:CAMPEP_0181374916 /NCGR_PEP_ID=MMETSP1106-20121128/16325_1 /TAXON_ID=81844 /ORGANISM="Mantoniella antarctica, Strain SL-175" /LENGTH=112 /DNA_ID=CAMNT_0023493029 /DNA_START=14 /DNA_END=349 /DNA_ORIENTATION=-
MWVAVRATVTNSAIRGGTAVARSQSSASVVRRSACAAVAAVGDSGVVRRCSGQIVGASPRVRSFSFAAQAGGSHSTSAAKAGAGSGAASLSGCRMRHGAGKLGSGGGGGGGG